MKIKLLVDGLTLGGVSKWKKGDKLEVDKPLGVKLCSEGKAESSEFISLHKKQVVNHVAPEVIDKQLENLPDTVKGLLEKIPEISSTHLVKALTKHKSKAVAKAAEKRYQQILPKGD